ncbi:hypothetical protein I5U59_09350 [Stenotrophomonas maltophilia]|nr:hypothetical protein [Stenotrophomonas maltophilia]MBH1503281.1 hypothetical protein [Stenotrophomonas maltophilia]
MIVTHNPYTGQPRDPRDVQSDPGAVLCVRPGAPLRAAVGQTKEQRRADP